ncbi:hypothetical protein [Pseudomonas putida]|uniref:hypothetical protein n=1 Tax=Pseudomonas putida TaxID=303 RepID=UPI0012FC7230|nr:hypothetical protein [Pseudomonas putida]ELS0926339.1 hypothetical protein [Pseudomonas putida]
MRLLLEEAQSDLIEMSFLISARLLIEGEADGAAVLTAVVQRLDVNQSDEATASLDVTPLKLGVWGAMEPKTNVSSESHRKGAFRSPAHPPGITL